MRYAHAFYFCRTASTSYLDPGTITATVLNNTFQSFNLIHAFDSGGFVNITARALIDTDTCNISINFADTLRTNIPYVTGSFNTYYNTGK